MPESQLRSTAGEGLSGVLKGDWTWSGVLGPHPESQGGPDEVREMLSFCPMPILASAPTDAFALGPRKGNPSLAPRPRHFTPDFLLPSHQGPSRLQHSPSVRGPQRWLPTSSSGCVE